jgi:hypothetical protein
VIPTKVRQIAWPFLLSLALASILPRTKTMTQTHSRSRQQAEIAFGKTQTEFFSRGQAVEVLDSIAQARDEKTARLREARKAKELVDRTTATFALIGKRSKLA